MDVDELIRPVSNLVSLPDVCLRANALLADPGSSVDEIGEVINCDPGLTARLLRIVNSAYYGLPARIETVTRAITVIGTRDLQSLVLATSAVDTFNRISTDLVDMEAFWHHSVFAGLAARNLAQEAGAADAEALFVAALLHDVGKLVMYRELPEASEQILALSADTYADPAQVERDVVGCDHADIGAALLHAWGLPESLSVPVRYHHRPEAADAFQTETALVHIANAIANTVEPGVKGSAGKAAGGDVIVPLAWELTGLSPEVISPTVSRVNLQSFELLEIIAPGSLLIP